MKMGHQPSATSELVSVLLKYRNLTFMVNTEAEGVWFEKVMPAIAAALKSDPLE